MTFTAYSGDRVEFVPPGTITIWTQNTGDIPSGWALCDGGNGTPNLLGKFVKGTSSASSSTGSTGGGSSYTISSSQMRSHSHGGSTNSASSHDHSIGEHTNTSGTGGYLGGTPWEDRESTRTTASAGSHSHDATTNSSGSGNSVDNIPAYMEVCYIMKL